jgi:RNA polymerase-interacting CarD/CdnL/TRCF family regulator
MVPTARGGTNGVRHENQKKDLREIIQTVPAGKQKRQEKNH